MRYAALLEQAADGTWGGYFPDLPGTAAAGYASAEEARTSLAEVLAMHVTGMREDGLALPKPSRVEMLEIG